MKAVQKHITGSRLLLSSHRLCALFILAMLAPGWSISQSENAAPSQSGPSPAYSQSSVQTTHPRYRPARFSKRAEEYYGPIWGVDSLSVRWAESGEVIRFSYRILDAEK